MELGLSSFIYLRALCAGFKQRKAMGRVGMLPLITFMSLLMELRQAKLKKRFGRQRHPRGHIISATKTEVA